jgi:hypothetical protein
MSGSMVSTSTLGKAMKFAVANDGLSMRIESGFALPPTI